jgi:hypothetical protein
MSHTEKDHDGMKVLVVADMNARFDEEGKQVSAIDMEGLEIVHATEIAKYYGVPLRSIGQGDNEVKGVWAMVHANEFGLRVPYNSEASRRGNRNVRAWKVLKDANGNPLNTKEEIKRYTTHHNDSGAAMRDLPLIEELDDGMYAKLADVLEYAAAQGWKKAGGRPGTGATAAHADATNDKLDKLVDTVQALAQIIAQQAIQAHAGSKK